jgi:hypothetical protein
MDWMPDENAVPISEKPPSRDAEFWSRRKTAVAAFGDEAFSKRTLFEANLALVASDLFSQLNQLNEAVERTVALTDDPLDKVEVIRAVMPETNKTTRELRALTEFMFRLDRDRDRQELDWDRQSKPNR